MKKAVKIVLSGTVQGVFFRNFIKDSADSLKIKGFTRNLEDGNVEIIAEGNQEEVEKFVEICRQGPKYAKIKNTKVEEKNYSGEYPDFKILRF